MEALKATAAGRKLVYYASAGIIGEIVGGSVVGRGLEGTATASKGQQPEIPFFATSATERGSALVGIIAAVSVAYMAKKQVQALIEGAKKRHFASVTQLPIVQSEVFYPFAHETSTTGPSFTERELERISRDDTNPQVAAYVQTVADRYEEISGSSEAGEIIRFTGVAVYRLLESQAAANKLSGDISS